jgi:acetylglutamate kinase
MNLTNADWADVLVQALPYFKEYAGQTVVVKYGGNAMLNDDLKLNVMEDLVLLNTIGIRVALVHGGGPEISAMLERVGKESKFINGLRYTDAETMEIVEMVLGAKINKDIVGRLLKVGGRAVGLSGIDGGMLRAKKLEKDGVDYGLVGEITAVEPHTVESLLNEGFIPVISTVAVGDKDPTRHFNINADTAAAKLAGALKALKFVQMTNVSGVLRDVKDPSSLIKEINRADIPGMISSGVISEGMIPKIECCMEALESGVPRTHIIDGRVPHALLIEMFSDRGIGTMIL